MTGLKLSDQMHHATDAVSSPTERLVAAGIERGRVLRRRRQVVQSLAAAAVATVISGSAVVAPTIVGSSHTPSVSPQSQGAAASDTLAFGVRADRMAQTLAGLLPSGTTSALDNRSGQSFRSGSLLFDDGRGVARVDVFIERVSDKGWGPRSKPSVPSEEPAAGTLRTFANASEYPHGNPGGVVSSGAEWCEDAFCVSVTAYNAPAEKGEPKTRRHPPLTVKQLTVIAKNPVWLR